LSVPVKYDTTSSHVQEPNRKRRKWACGVGSYNRPHLTSILLNVLNAQEKDLQSGCLRWHDLAFGLTLTELALFGQSLIAFFN